MANGKLNLGKQSGGVLSLTFPDGVTNTEVVLPESGVIAKVSDINTAGIELQTIATGTATFTATTNNINLTGIGIGVEIGDVIQISGAEDAKNNSEFTVEVITDNDNIIVNQAHANKGTSKNVATRSSDTGVTVKLLAKWYNASDSLGRDWVDVTSIRTNNTNYPNNTKRAIELNITVLQNANADQQAQLYSGSSVIGYSRAGGGAIAAIYVPVNATAVAAATYKVNSSGSIITWYEKR